MCFHLDKEVLPVPRSDYGNVFPNLVVRSNLPLDKRTALRKSLEDIKKSIDQLIQTVCQEDEKEKEPTKENKSLPSSTPKGNDFETRKRQCELKKKKNEKKRKGKKAKKLVTKNVQNKKKKEEIKKPAGKKKKQNETEEIE